ncbi:MAG: RagB/SusD family nutrient uptake outer membrane protein, partial [Duncaniella sp.]|nr:RagB/SusD family nutrient uptake outer membrane protein [Duncaniella sp.]
NETYQSDYATAFQNEVWWQRRVEFWGEGLATFDIKRLNKGIIRSYPNTNHGMDTRWNTTTPPQWMTWCIIGTEADYNLALSGKNNPTPVKPSGDSPEYIFGN